MLSLIIIDMAMQKCGQPFHVQVGTKEFMNVLVALLHNKELRKEVSLLTSFDLVGDIRTLNLTIFLQFHLRRYIRKCSNLLRRGASDSRKITTSCHCSRTSIELYKRKVFPSIPINRSKVSPNNNHKARLNQPGKIQVHQASHKEEEPART